MTARRSSARRRLRDLAVVLLALVAMIGVLSTTATATASAQEERDRASIVLSADFGTANGPVVRLYLAALGRRPDDPGLDYWREIHSSGYHLHEIAGYFVGSAEFIARYGDLDPEGFVTLVYANVLGRAPDAPGLAYWVGLMEDGHPRGTILNGFAQSPEFIHQITNRPVTPVIPSAPAVPSPLLLIGDSIFHGLNILSVDVGGAEVLYKTEEGRQADTLPALLDEAKADGSFAQAEAVVIHLGTNGWKAEWEAMFNNELTALANTSVYLVNMAAERSWESTTNEALDRIATNHGHVTLIDWNEQIAEQPEWLRPDRVHPTRAGLDGLAELLVQALLGE